MDDEIGHVNSFLDALEDVAAILGTTWHAAA